MKKRILSVLAAIAVLLGSASGIGAADKAELSPRASLAIDEGTGYLRGITSVPTADFIAGQFTGDVTLISPDGNTISGETAVPADTIVKSGDTELARVLVPGDASRDAKVNISDVSAMLKHIAKWSEGISVASADVDGNETVNLADVSQILKYIAKWDVELGSPEMLSIIKYSTVAQYNVLANDADADAAFVAYIKNVTGVELSIVTETLPDEDYITIGTDLAEKYDFIDKAAADAVDNDKAYIDTYGGSVYICVKGADGVEFAAQTIAAEFDGMSLGIPKGYVGPMTHMTERGRLYWNAVENILKTSPAVDGTNGMNEDIYVAISNANYTEPKNIIYMIGDGMGKNIAIAAEYCHKDDLYGGKLTMNYLPVEGRQSTYSTDQQTTDSAAGGTALATGYKTTNGTIAMNTDDTVAYKTLLELAADKGKSTGVVATKSVTDATPATFTAHVEDRSYEVEIAGQQLSKLIDGTLDVIFGGGYAYYNDGANAGARAAAKEIGVTYTNSWDEACYANTPVAGIFTEHEMSTDPASDEPTLAAMTDLAIELLAENDNGFFLMVEGSKIDSYGHSNDFGAEVDEAYEFDCAVAVALRYVALNPDTVLVITADHETGGLAIPAEPTVDNIRTSSRYSTGGHLWVDVPVYAVGYGTEVLSGNQENADIAIFLAEAMGEENFGQRSEVFELFDVANKSNVYAIIAHNDSTDAVKLSGNGMLVNFGKGDGKIQYVYVPAGIFDVPEEERDTITAFRVSYTNLSNEYERIPSCGVRMEDGTNYTAGERITYIAPGETITYTYNLSSEFRYSGSLADTAEFIIYATAGYEADMLISDITVVSRPLDK